MDEDLEESNVRRASRFSIIRVNQYLQVSTQQAYLTCIMPDRRQIFACGWLVDDSVDTERRVDHLMIRDQSEY